MVKNDDKEEKNDEKTLDFLDKKTHHKMVRTVFKFKQKNEIKKQGSYYSLNAN